MKLVAKKDFANVPSLALTGLEVPTHVPKGKRFAVGAAELFADLSQTEKTLVAQLMVSKAVVADDSDKANVAAIAKIDAEVKAEAIAAAKAAKPVSMEEAVASAVASALVAAGVIKAKAA